MANRSDSGDERFMIEFTRNQRRIYYTIVSVIHSHADAEDVFQNVSVKLWRSRESFNPELGSFAAWAGAITHNEIRSFYRKHQRDRARVVPDDELVNQMLAVEAKHADFIEDRVKALRHCLSRLDDKNRALIEQFYDRRKNIDELAELFSLARRTLYRRVDQIRDALYTCLKRRGEEAPVK